MSPKSKNELVKLKMRKKRRPYPPKHREKLAQKALDNRPWQHATGPRTTAGKAASSQNALKSGLHTATLRKLKRLLRQLSATAPPPGP